MTCIQPIYLPDSGISYPTQYYTILNSLCNNLWWYGCFFYKEAIGKRGFITFTSLSVHIYFFLSCHVNLQVSQEKLLNSLHPWHTNFKCAALIFIISSWWSERETYRSLYSALKQFQYCSSTFQTHHNHPAIIRILIQPLEEDLEDLADIIRPTIQILPPWRLMLVIQAVILAWMSIIQAVSLITAVVMTKTLVSCRHLPSRSARLYNTIIPIFINPYPEDQPLWPQVEHKAQIPVLCWPAALWIWMEKAGHSPNHNLAVSLLILSAAGLEHHPKKGLPDVKKWFWKRPKKVGWLISTISSIWIPP